MTQRLPHLFLPEVRLQTSARDDLPIEQVQLTRFDGTRSVRFSEAGAQAIAALRQPQK